MTSAVCREHPELGTSSTEIRDPEWSDILRIGYEREILRWFQHLGGDPVDPGSLHIDRRQVNQPSQFGGVEDDILNSVSKSKLSLGILKSFPLEFEPVSSGDGEYIERRNRLLDRDLRSRAIRSIASDTDTDGESEAREFAIDRVILVLDDFFVLSVWTYDEQYQFYQHEYREESDLPEECIF